MGFHADDDQEESMILSVIASSPDESPRKVVFQTKKKHKGSKFLKDDVQYELSLNAGDGYDMDGKSKMLIFELVSSFLIIPTF